MKETEILSYATSEHVPLLTVRQAKIIFRLCQWYLIGCAAATFLLRFFAIDILSMFFFMLASPVALAAIAAGIAVWGRWMGQQRRLRQVLIIIACPILIASIVLTDWPLKLSFSLSTPALNRLADQVAAGKTPALPQRAGIYTIRWIENRGTSICLWTQPPGNDHIGFVRSPVGVTPKQNPYTHKQLSDRWHYFGAD